MTESDLIEQIHAACLDPVNGGLPPVYQIYIDSDPDEDTLIVFQPGVAELVGGPYDGGTHFDLMYVDVQMLIDIYNQYATGDGRYFVITEFDTNNNVISFGSVQLSSGSYEIKIHLQPIDDEATCKMDGLGNSWMS